MATQVQQTPVTEAMPSATKPPAKPKKKLVRRSMRDRSQQWRRAVQLAFLALNVWLGIQFYLFVRFYETGGQGWHAPRPAGVEGWLPIAALMNLKDLLLTGQIPSIHPAGMFLLLAFLGVSFAFRKAFCSWLCPVGTISEGLWHLGRKLFRRNFRMPRWLDVGLRSLKYILLGLFVYAVVNMSVGAIRMFLEGPYGVIADVKMLNFFRYLGVTGAIVLGTLVVLSLVYQNFWCRYLCPYGALMGLPAMLSPLRIRRDPSACIDCAKCAKACPALLPVDVLVTVRSAECTGCLECVAVCPAEGALEMTTPKLNAMLKPRRMPAWAMAAGIALIFVGVVIGARLAGHWQTAVPDSVYFQLVPHANEFGHP